MKELLKLFSEELEALGINYDYLVWKVTPIPYPYTVGEYYESNYIEEEHKSEGEMLLTVWDRSKTNEGLIEVNQKLKKHFGDFRKIVNNTSIHISYSSSLPVLQEAENLKKQEMRFDIEYWEGVNN